MLASVVDPAAPLARRLVYALKPRSWPKLLVAAWLGQAVGVAAAGSFDLVAALLGFAFTAFDLAFLVLLNDWGDRDVDALKRRMFPDVGGRKTIPDRLLAARSVLELGLGAAAFAVGTAVTVEILRSRPGACSGALVCLSLFVAYTLPPVKLNYRGGGELLEMLGVGFALPWWNVYVQSGLAAPRELAWLPGFALLALASALASGLSDEESDRLGGKRTFTTMFGKPAVRAAVEGMLVATMLVWAMMPKLAPAIADWGLALPAVTLLAWCYRDVAKASQSLDIDEPEGLSRYKAAVHGCIWWSAAMLGTSLVLRTLLVGAQAG